MNTKKASPPCFASATTPTATIAASAGGRASIAAIDPTAATARIAPLAVRVTTPLSGELTDGHRPAPPLLPPAQDLPVFGSERAEDRLQGYAPALALHLRARQDRAFAHHGGFGQEAARTRSGDQAREVPWPLALCDPVGSGLKAIVHPERTIERTDWSRRKLARSGW